MSNIKKMPIKVLTTAPCLKMNNLLTKKNYKANNIQCWTMGNSIQSL